MRVNLRPSWRLASGFKDEAEKAAFSGSEPVGSRLFHVRVTDARTTKVIQVECTSTSLNSTDCFIMDCPKALYVWSGTSSTGDERESTKKVSKLISSRENVLLLEGMESADFWAALGGKQAYTNLKTFEIGSHVARLFQCSNNKGYFYAEEVFDFDQEVGGDWFVPC